MQGNKTYSAGGIVVNPYREVLLVQEYGFYWGLPRGHIEENESPLAAAVREIEEEAGIAQLTLVERLGTYERYRFDKQGQEIRSELKNITFFLFTTPQIALALSDQNITAAEWVAPHEADKRFIHPKDIEFYAKSIHEVNKLLK